MSLAGEQVHGYIADGTKGDTFGNAVAEGHGNDGNVGRNGFTEIIEVDADNGAEHQEPYDDQSRSSGKGRNSHKERGQEQGQQEQHSNGNRRQPGPAAFGNPGSTFYESGNGAGTHHSTYAGGHSISQQSPLDMGQLVVFVQHIALGGYANDGAQGIKQVHKQEREDNHKEVQGEHPAKVHLHKERRRADGQEGRQPAGKIGEYAEGAQLGIRYVQAHGFAQHAGNPGAQNPKQDVALHVFNNQNSSKHNAQHGQENGNPHTVERAVGHGLGKGIQRNLRGRVGDDDPGVQKTDEGDEQTNTYGNGLLQGQRNGVENRFPDTGQGQQNENDTFHENRGQSHLPGIAHLLHHRVGKVGVEPHAGGQSKRIVGKDGHENGTNGGRNGRNRQQSPFIHARAAENQRVDNENVGHGHKGSNPGDDFRPGGGVGFLEMEDPFKKLFHTKLLFSSPSWE